MYTSSFTSSWVTCASHQVYQVSMYTGLSEITLHAISCTAVHLSAEDAADAESVLNRSVCMQLYYASMGLGGPGTALPTCTGTSAVMYDQNGDSTLSTQT